MTEKSVYPDTRPGIYIYIPGSDPGIYMYIYICTYINKERERFRGVGCTSVSVTEKSVCPDMRRLAVHPRSFDEHLGSTAEAIDYVRSSGN